MKNKSLKFKFVDLFAGIGGMRLGLEKCGGLCVMTSEINKDCLTTYKANFRSAERHFYNENILELNKKDIPEHDLLVGGFPCQPYSIAGLRNGLKDERGGEIFKSILKILKYKKPKAFLLENVKGMVSHGNGKTLEYMIKALRSCKYYIKYQVLNSCEHANVAQFRERVFIVGFRKKSQANSFVFPSKTKLTKKINFYLLKDKADEKFYYNDRFECFKELKKKIISTETVYQWRRVYVRENKKNICFTLTYNMGSGGHNVPLIKDNFGIRKITPREVANFQGFPKSFKLPKLSNSKLYQQLGNSVTVPLINKIGNEILRVM